MKRLTVRMDDYTYKKIELMAKHYNKTVNAIIIELIQTSIKAIENCNNLKCTKEEQGENDGKSNVWC